MTDSQEQVLFWPYPQQEAKDCEYLRDGVFQLKMKAIQLLNKAAAGTYILSKENIEGIEELNVMCQKVGLSPLNF